MTGFGQVVMVDALMAADESIVQRTCNYCQKSFVAVEGNLERLCPVCRRK